MLPFCVKSCIDLYKMYRPLYFFLVFGLFAGCRGSSNRHPVPYAPVNETIYLNTPSAYDLQFVGGRSPTANGAIGAWLFIAEQTLAMPMILGSMICVAPTT